MLVPCTVDHYDNPMGIHFYRVLVVFSAHCLPIARLISCRSYGFTLHGVWYIVIYFSGYKKSFTLIKIAILSLLVKHKKKL